MHLFNKKTPHKLRARKTFLEKKLNVQIKIKAQEAELEGEELDVYVASRVIQAIDNNFPIETALSLLNEEYMLETINIKDISNKKDLRPIKARIIGTQGKTIQILSELSDCYLVLHDNNISILGPNEKIKDAVSAITSLIKGSKQANIYYFLEKQKKKPIIHNLGLKLKNK